ncbi:MAG TPA: glycosyltransferase [Acidobacteriota bacterium]|nr:glycosyltransferase [Acidobacteriota bacterium]
MGSHIKTTIGLCVKNAEVTIRDAIESVMSQDFPHELIELIVVDGYSKDRTVSILRDYLDKSDIKIRILFENEGLGRARQLVVDNTRGDYVVWVDSDMVLPRDFVREQVRFMEQNPSVGIGKGKYTARKEDSIVATLENTEFLLNFNREGETNSRSLGTSGCIYRIEAVRQARGFDETIKGVGEDMDIEYRIKHCGWKLSVTPAAFYEKRRQNWKSLWNEYFWHGYGWHSILRKNIDLVNLNKLLPPVAIIAESIRVPAAYRLTHRKVVLLLPLHYVFKRTAWLLGLLSSSLNYRTPKRN